jgi:hypothetical protein
MDNIRMDLVERGWMVWNGFVHLGIEIDGQLL